MKIILPTLYDTRGGSTRVLLACAAALRDAHAVRVRAPLDEADDPMPADFPAAPLVGARAKAAILPRLARLVAREAAYLRRVRPDVVWVHDEPALYVHGLAARALSPRPVIVWHLHMTAGTGLARRLRLALADRIVSVSRHAAAALPGATILRNPVAPPPAAPAAAGGPSISVVGALVPRKNAGLALDVLAALPDSLLALIGPELDPAYAAALRDRAAPFGARVAFLGPRPADEVWAAASGVALFPSRLENQPLALVEAVLVGRPVVATDIPAHREIFQDLGLDPAGLAPPEPAALARAIRTARPPDPVAVALARALFAPERFADEVRAFTARLPSPGWARGARCA